MFNKIKRWYIDFCKRHSTAVGIVELEDYIIPSGHSVFTNLHGWWTPPNEVLEFWAAGCKYRYLSDNWWFIDLVLASKEADTDIEKIKQSYEKAIQDFYRINAL
ncbi:MAG: hypothetical protein V3U54_07925 [Thermodesulfobacteriota bacterium]